MIEAERRSINWLDVIWLMFLAGLAVLPPIREIHKQLTLLAIGGVQLSESRIILGFPRRGRYYVVFLKLFLAALLIDHTGGLGINSSYYPIYYLPVVTAAMYFGPWATLIWTLFTSASYCSFLYPALQEYQLSDADFAELAIRIAFFFLFAMIVNRFAVENRRQTRRYQMLAEQLAETNRQLQIAQAEARRSERLAALGQMSAGLAHEIRNPLAVIKGSAEILHQKLDASNPLASELAGYISSEVNRLSLLVSRFLDFARPLQAETRPESITQVLDRALKSVASRWKGGEVTVENAYEEGLPLVALDADLGEQAFLNLIQNAYEAMGSQGGNLRVEVRKTERNGGAGVEINLEDSGPGVPTELHEQIFNPFVTTKESGVGLGLSIVSKIIDEHHGHIRLENAPVHGARFVIFLPAAESTMEKEGAVVRE